ncbi:deoxynucleoside triphosphate triphosphohydrolase SAMHD1-like, partial [Octopus bimaculoides]|uniref:deoxynucleoside triphosphate triphosphohydrolase SAMHD1-like n=1 Tax=Octopus bimaculoides TaxID=37653 RepID=UPI0022E4CC06
HLAGKMIRHLKQQDSNLGITDRDILCVEIAGLFDFIKDIIIGEQRKSKKSNFFYQIVSNNFYNIDVDKWDYLARDSHFLGIGTSFDHERMLKMSKVIDGTLCYRDKT